MRRPELLALVGLAAVLACAGRGEAPRTETGAGSSGGPDSNPSSNPGAAVVAGSSATSSRAPLDRRPASTDSGRPGARAPSPVAVVALAAAEASVCEAMCGGVGDCLKSEGRGREASHLELACLDVCAGAPEDHPAGRRFRACGEDLECGALLDCSERNWSEAAAARTTTPVEVEITSRADPCAMICGGVYSCMLYDRTPRDALEDMMAADPTFAQGLEACRAECDVSQSSTTELAACTQRDTCEEMWACWEQVGVHL